MTSPGWTAGPWTVVGREVHATDPRETIVCEVTGSVSNPQAAADARLIAAAPELYRELADLANAADAYMTYHVEKFYGDVPTEKVRGIRKQIDASRAALAKARGEQ